MASVTPPTPSRARSFCELSRDFACSRNLSAMPFPPDVVSACRAADSDQSRVSAGVDDGMADALFNGRLASAVCPGAAGWAPRAEDSSVRSGLRALTGEPLLGFAIWFT